MYLCCNLNLQVETIKTDYTMGQSQITGKWLVKETISTKRKAGSEKRMI